MWIDIASIVFVCVTANHLGLIGKLEEIMGKLPIINCPKCFTFWSVLIYVLWEQKGITGNFPLVLAISFLCAYLALWLELLEGFIDTLYLWLYEKNYTNTENDTPAADADGGNSAGSVS